MHKFGLRLARMGSFWGVEGRAWQPAGELAAVTAAFLKELLRKADLLFDSDADTDLFALFVGLLEGFGIAEIVVVLLD